MLNYFRSLFGFSIKRQVMKAVNEKIKSAQALYDQEEKELNVKFQKMVRVTQDQYENTLENLKNDAKNDKQILINKHVETVMSKFI